MFVVIQNYLGSYSTEVVVNKDQVSHLFFVSKANSVDPEFMHKEYTVIVMQNGIQLRVEESLSVVVHELSEGRPAE